MEKYGNLGKNQGDMSPKVEDYQRPGSVYSQEGFNSTTEYVARNNARQSSEASEIKKQAHKGRYS